MINWNEKVKNLDDYELELELIKLTNDSYLHTRKELENSDYFERHEAIWAELEVRGEVEYL